LKPDSYSEHFEREKWSDFVLISWLYSRPGLLFGVYPLYNEFSESQFKMNLDTKVIGYYSFLHLNKKTSYQSLNVDCPPIGVTTYFQPHKSKEIRRCTLYGVELEKNIWKNWSNMKDGLFSIYCKLATVKTAVGK
jgi:hypothetical protein